MALTCSASKCITAMPLHYQRTCANKKCLRGALLGGCAVLGVAIAQDKPV